LPFLREDYCKKEIKKPFNLFTLARLLEKTGANLLNNTNMQRKNLTKLQRAEFTLTQRQREIVVGCILGDLNVEKCPPAMLGALPHR
jgi:FixJ family two-component response regulator